MRTAFALVAVCAFAGCGGFPKESPPASLQQSLRSLARDAPAGKHAYWLGVRFHDAPVTFSDGSFSPWATVTYSDQFGDGAKVVDVDVITHLEFVETTPAGFSRVVTMPSGQPVQLLFRSPKQPSAELIAQIESAIRPIPENVEYDGFPAEN
jgi:hypothetical protein